MKKRMTPIFVALGSALFAVALLVSMGRLLAAPVAVSSSSPAQISYQGYLSDSNGSAISGTVALQFAIYDAESGGDLKWQEVQTDVSVDNGYFAVQLGAVTALTAPVFGGTPRYLEVGLNTDNSGGGPFSTLPRQVFSSVPYAFWSTQALTGTYALTSTYASTSGYSTAAATAISSTYATTATNATTATYAASASWGGLTGVPSGFADGSDDGSNYAGVVVVAESGGHYTSVVEALNSVTATASSPYLVWVAPGVYTESELVAVRGYIHLQGAGPDVTKIVSTRSGTVQNSDSATARLYNHGRISDLGLYNSGTSSTYAIAIWMADDVTRASVVDNVKAIVDGSGGVGHYAVYASDAEPTIKRSWLHARGGSTVNAAFGSTNSTGGGFPQAHIEDSVLLGGEEDIITCTDNTGTGYAMQMVESSPIVWGSYLCGGHRAVFSAINGNPRFHSSIVSVSSTNGAYLVETTASGIVSFGTSQLTYITGAQTGLSTGAGSAPRCAQSYHGGTFADLAATCAPVP